MEYIQTSLFGKTSPEPTAATRERTSDGCLKRSRELQTPPCQYLDLRAGDGTLAGALWETVTALPGVPWALNTGESPKDVRESFLSQILEADAPRKYYLSEAACKGILRRAEKRGKELPPLLKAVLELESPIEIYPPVCCDGNGCGAGEITSTLTTSSGRNSNKMCVVFDKTIVRLLMPVEEARLQGFPDWWCADVPHKDTPEYRMWGNGVALPCVLYVMEGIAECLGNDGGNK